MLTQILDLLKSTEKPQTLDHLSQEMDVERSAMQAMLDHLVNKGKISKVTPSSTDPDNKQPFAFCKRCRSSFSCADSLKMPTYYTLIESGH